MTTARSRKKFIENCRTLPQCMVKKKFAIRIDNVESEISNGNFPHQLCADFFPPKSLLQRAERQGPPASSRIPSHNLSVENRVFRQGGKCRRQFRKRLGDLIARARKDADLASTDMHLGADAIVLILNRRILKITQRLFRRLNRTRQHEIDGMKHPQLRFCQLSLGGKPQSLSQIAEQHVGALHLIKRSFERARNRFFDQTFFEADAKVSANNLHDVFCFERRDSPKKFAQKRSLRSRSACNGDCGKYLLQFGEQQTRFWLRRQRLAGDRSGVAKLSVYLGQFRLGFSRQLTYDAP